MCCQKKWHWYHKTKSVIISVGNVHLAPQYMHSLIFSFFLHLVERFVQWCFKYTVEYSVSVLLLYAGCFYSHSLWETTRDWHVVVLDPEFKEYQGIMQSPKKLHIICIVEFSVFAIIPCFCSSTSNKDMKFIISVW